MVNFYNDNATNLAQQYLSKSFEEVHQSWADFLPSIIANPNARILDLGAGSGRDAKYLADIAQKTHQNANNVQVLATEPATELLQLGLQTTAGSNVKWISDSLPWLDSITKLEVSFDLILLSAVWMHVHPSERACAIQKLANLLKPGGNIVISLRYSQIEEDLTERGMYAVCAYELKKLASEFGLFCKLETPIELDKLGRNYVSWQTVVLQAN